jgi:glycosyltransferase involved in cell wall biosynthesis
LGRVLVVDDGSTDGTAAAARAAGAEVLSLSENAGKGGALAAGTAALSEDVLVLLDADLVGLIPEQIIDLAAPVMRGEADMTRGSFTGGRWRTTAAQKIAPQLSGQRAVLRDKLLSVPGLAESRYGVEVAITREAKERDWRLVEVDLPGVSQVMKEEKLGRWSGFVARLKMYRDVLMTLVSGRKRKD